MARHNLATRTEAVRLRVEDRLSAEAIRDKLAVPLSTVCSWIKSYPLTAKELHERMSKSGAASKGREPFFVATKASRLFELVGDRTLTNMDKARISEAAVLLRLTAVGLEPFGSPFDGDTADWIVRTRSGAKILQVKFAYRGKYGAPCIRLRRSDGRGRSRSYKAGEVDIFVGYDLYSDIAAVWTWREVRKNQTVSFRDDAVERWDKIR